MRKYTKNYTRLHSFLILALCFFTQKAFTQVIGNEWINTSQSYFKIKIIQKGIHQITFEELQKARFPKNINPDKIQLFRKGREVAISVKSESNGIFKENDFISFYGENNDGSLDSLLYNPNTSQPHPNYSLFSDTASYFLTYYIDNQKGKRIDTFISTNYQAIKTEVFHLEEVIKTFVLSYSEGQLEPVGASLNTGILTSDYSYGKGWSGEIIPKNTSSNIDINLKNFISNSFIQPTLELVVAGRSAGNRSLSIWSNQVLVDTINFDNYATYRLTKSLALQPITNQKLQITTRANEAYSVSYLKFTYPQSCEMKGLSEKVFHFPPNQLAKKHFLFQNSPKNAFLFDITDRYNPIKISFQQQDSSIHALGEGYDFLLSNQVKKPFSIEKIHLKNLKGTHANFLIITHQKLLKSAYEYANYRASKAGGQYDTLTVTTDFLYNYFTYGDKNTLAIRRFLALMKSNNAPQFAFFIGSAKYPQDARKNSVSFQQDLVPTWGFPCGDVPFGMNYENQDSIFITIPIGRLSTDNPQTILDYLNKVKEHEANPMDALWRKNALMMSGGRSIFELNTFKDYVNNFKEVSEHGLLGQHVSLLSKKSDNPTEFINVTDQVNQGLGMITMFGHSASQQTDMDIGYCSNDLFGYKNKGKYPFILVNGCNAGDLFSSQLSFGTDWINTPNRGAILFLAHSYLSSSNNLKSYSDEIFHTLFQDSLYYDKAFGTIMKASINRYLSKFPHDVFTLANAQQFTLQGDPAIVLFPATKPDYTIDNNSIFLQNIIKNTSVDSIKIGVIIKNLGRISQEKLTVQLKRIYPNGVIDKFETYHIQPINYLDTLYFSIPNDKTISTGNNNFEIYIDPENKILELKKDNNAATFAYNFPTNKIAVLFPKPFAIISQKEVDFTLQIPQIDTSQIVIELDTNYLFNSNFYKKTVLIASPLISWSSILLEKDSTVYYWRAKSTNEKNWIEGSFLYLKNSNEGFAQFSFPQLLKSTTDKQVYLDNLQWKFSTSSVKISAKIYGTNSGVPRSHRANSLMLDDKILISDGVCYPWFNLNAIAFNRALRVYSVLPNLVCGYSPYSVNYLSDDTNTTDFQDYLQNTLAGNYIVLWNSGHLSYQKWTSNFIQNFAKIGVDSNKIKQLADGSPFLVIGRKGAKKALLELFPNTIKRPDTQILSLDNFELKDVFDEGTITSPLIGSATEWGELKLTIEKDSLENQHSYFDILGINLKGEESILYEKIYKNTLNISDIDALKYPFIKVRIHVKTEKITGKAPQLKALLITYKSPPEGIISINSSSKISDKQEYEDFQTKVVFKNISNTSFTDSITVRQIIRNRALNKSEYTLFKVKKLDKNDSISLNIPFKTAGWLKENTLSITFNPEILPEQSYQNNSIDYTFNVIPDKINPILSVTFDGRQIQQYERVSSKPKIRISLKDENRFRIKKDTSGIDLWIKYCSKCTFNRISLDNPNISWRSDSTQNDFILEYFPQDLPEDTLTIIVQGSDVAGNLSGIQPYQISFRTIQQEGFKHWKVFPNPFHFFTKFSFELSGEYIPTEFAIEVFDIQGKQVAFISPNKSLHIGLNEIIWEAKDFSNNYLVAGTYFYRLISKNKTVDLTLGTSGKLIISH